MAKYVCALLLWVFGIRCQVNQDGPHWRYALESTSINSLFFIRQKKIFVFYTTSENERIPLRLFKIHMRAPAKEADAVRRELDTLQNSYTGIRKELKEAKMQLQLFEPLA